MATVEVQSAANVFQETNNNAHGEEKAKETKNEEGLEAAVATLAITEFAKANKDQSKNEKVAPTEGASTIDQGKVDETKENIEPAKVEEEPVEAKVAPEEQTEVEAKEEPNCSAFFFSLPKCLSQGSMKSCTMEKNMLDKSWFKDLIQKRRKESSSYIEQNVKKFNNLNIKTKKERNVVLTSPSH